MQKPKEELQLKIQIDKLYNFDLDTDLDIDKAEINRELSQQPALFAWYAVVSEMAKNKVLLVKNELELMEASLDQKVRQSWNVDIQGKLTEASVQAVVRLTTTYQKKEQQYFEAKKAEGILGVAKQAFEQRKDMLISIASNMRAESDIDLKINKEKVAAKIRQAK